MPYPDERYPADPDFPRPQSTKTTKENDLMDRDWYEVVCSYIEDINDLDLICKFHVDTDYNAWGGVDALVALIDGTDNTVIGDSAGYSVTSGSGESLFGSYNGLSIEDGDNNSAFGIGGLSSNISGQGNSSFGAFASSWLEGDYNANGGYLSLGSGSTSLDYTTSWGAYSAYCLESSYGGVYIGAYSGFQVEDDLDVPNTMIGWRSGYNITGTSRGNIVLGSEAGAKTAGEYDHQGWIDNRATDRPLIKLEMGDPDVDTDPRNVIIHGDNIIHGQMIDYYGRKNPYVKICLDMNADFTDSSINGHAPTVTGATIDTVNQRWGVGCGSFNGSTDDVAYADADDWYLGIGEWTWEGWFKPDTLPTGSDVMPLIMQYADLTNYFGIFLDCSISGNELALNYKGDGDFYLYYASITDITDDWHHLMVSRSGANLYFWLDGTLLTTNKAVTSDTFSKTSNFINIAGSLYLGKDIAAYANMVAYDGLMDEVRLTKDICWFVDDFLAQHHEFGTV